LGALEHRGIPPSTLRRSQTGVFAGACYTDYGYVAGMDLTNVDAWSNSGGALSIIANRLSYFLDLRGPSVTVTPRARRRSSPCTWPLRACASGTPMWLSRQA